MALSCNRPSELMKTHWLRISKYYINTGSFRHYNNYGSTHPLMAASRENKLLPTFSGFKPQTFPHESSYDGVSGTDNDEKSLNNSASVLHLWLVERLPDFKMAVYFLKMLLVNTELSQSRMNL